MKEAPKWKIIGRGFAGWHASVHNISSSGGQLLPYTYWTGEKCEGYAEQAEEGCPVYDAQPCEQYPELEHAFRRLIVSGPVPKVDLEDQGEAAYIHAHALDYIPLAEFFRRLRRIPRIKFGVVKHGQVEWEPETVRPTIPDIFKDAVQGELV